MDSCLDLVLRALPVAMELHYFIFQGIVKYNQGGALVMSSLFITVFAFAVRTNVMASSPPTLSSKIVAPASLFDPFGAALRNINDSQFSPST